MQETHDIRASLKPMGLLFFVVVVYFFESLTDGVRGMKNALIGLFVFLLSVVPGAVFAAEAAPSCPELTGLQVVAGFVTWMNVLQVFAIVLVVVCVGVLAWKWFGWLLEIFAHIPVQVYEALGYIVSTALVVSGYFLAPENQLWSVFTGCLLFAVMLIITSTIHKLQENYQRFFGILFLVWSVVALFYDNAYVGFIAMGAFTGMLGFSVIVTPLCYTLGFQGKDSLSQATVGAFVMLVLFVALRIAGEVTALRVFEQGALWLGSFVGYLGILIASTKWYRNRATYPIMQVIAIFLGMAALGVGSVFNIPQLLGIGGTFFVLYLIEKPFEIPAGSVVGYAMIGLLVGLSVGGGVWWAQNNMELVRPFLLF